MNPEKLILLPKSKVKIVYDNRTEEVKKARPILMKPWGIEATLEERKTVTRRIIPVHTGFKINMDAVEFERFYIQDNKLYAQFIDNKTGFLHVFNCRQGKPGDLLYIRKNYYVRREDAEEWLLINDIRCERLQDIKEEGAQREGVKPALWHIIDKINDEHLGKNLIDHHILYRNGFANEWDKINANRKDKEGNILSYAWKDNPWVFPIGYSLFFQARGSV